MQANITLPWSIWFDDGPAGFAYVENVDGLSCHAPSLSVAKKRLREAFRNKVADMAIQDSNQEKQIIGCGDGTVFVVSFQNGSWGYTINGQGRSYASSCWGYGDDFQSAKEHALVHAKEAFGGVVWQHRT